MKPIKVLVGYITRDFGGVESFFLSHCSKINNDLFTVDFLCTGAKPSFEKQILDLGSKIHYITAPGNNLKKHYNDLYKVFNEGDYDIFHLNLTRYKLPLDVILAKRFGVKVILHSHSTQVYQAKTKLKNIKRMAEHYLFKVPTLRTADQLVACSKTAKKFLFGARKTRIIYNGINTELYKFSPERRVEIRNEVKLTGNRIIGHIGRMSSEKNHEFLLKVFLKIYEKDRNARLLLVGDGDLKKTIEKKAEHMGLKSFVKFTGARYDVESLLSAMDVFVLPSVHEALPISLIEAQAAGLNSVVSKNVTTEIDVTGNVKFVSLDESIICWANIIMDSTTTERVDMGDIMQTSGFDILDTVRELEELWKNILSNKEG